MKHFFTRRTAGIAFLATGLVLAAALLWRLDPFSSGEATGEQAAKRKIEKPPSTSSPKASPKAKKARYEYFQRLQRDPATGQIPPNIRSRELAYAETLPTAEEVRGGKSGADGPSFDWFEAGPNDVGGRTRALAMDVDDPQTLLAGGVSGGMWKSTDGGATWSLTNTTAQRLSVTSVAQDPRSGHTDTWYYASGEYRGNSASGGSAPFRGGGLYKSTDNGDTWTKVVDANGPTDFDSPFDYVHRVAVSPSTGSVFVASNAYGIFRSTDGGNSFNRVLGQLNDHRWVEITVASDGTLLATLSSTGFTSNPANPPGIYVSDDDGQTWTDVTPGAFPSVHDRSVAAFVPSDSSIAYVYTTTLQGRIIGGQQYEDVRLHRFQLAAGDTVSTADRSDGLYSSSEGFLNTQGSYNMSIGVKPDDPNFVVVGATSLFRSDDGFSSSIEQLYDWIGGYSSGNGEDYRHSHHPDQHAVVFDPTDPDRMWTGSDGGVHVTEDVDGSGAVSWIDKNNGYNVTQFYTVDIPDNDSDNRIAGGTQDNGTPYLGPVADGANTTFGSQDISGADGSYLYFGDDKVYVSTQGGFVQRLDGNTLQLEDYVFPGQASGQLFIHPFAVDPSDEDVMYYPAGNTLWRTTQLSTADFSSQYWTELTGLPPIPVNCDITALAASRQPAHRLYFGASCFNQTKFYRLDSANSGDGSSAQDISISALPDGSYVHRIAVNPQDADELLVAHSNYNITGLYHSDDGGQTWTAVEGNLTGDAGNPGPSLRSVTILPTPAGTGYLVGTSTGVYSTTDLNGSNTTWALEASNLLGNAVVEAVASRPSDDRVAVASHGRGIFVSTSHDPLPVELTSFEARAEEDAVQLNWSTASETNNSGFEVQMQASREGGDQSGWEKVSFVEGSGTTTEAQQYAYRVGDLQPGTYRFRLKQIDTNDNTALSGVESAALSVAGTHQLTTAYPNPFRERAQFSLSVAQAQEVSIDLYDARGRRVRTLFDGSLPADQARTFRVKAADLASGVYFYRATGDRFTDSGRLVLVR